MVATIFGLKSLTASQSLHLKQGLGGPDFEIIMPQVPVQTGYQSLEKKVNNKIIYSIFYTVSTDNLSTGGHF